MQGPERLTALDFREHPTPGRCVLDPRVTGRVTLPEHLAGHQGHWGMVVERLGGNISALMSTLQDPSREAVTAAIETIHADYAELESIFDSEPGSTHEHEH